MYLSEIFDQLTYGELFHLEIGGGEDFGINPKNYPSLIANVNIALTALHTRFPLKMREIVVQQYDEITKYILDSKYAQSNTESTEPIKYIEDTIYDPFTNDLIKIEQVFNEDGEEVKLNDSHADTTVYTPAFNIIQVPAPTKENSLSVIYRADYDRIKITDNFDPAAIEIDIPWSLMEPLLFYTAHRYLAVNGLQGSGQDSINYLNKYTGSCNKIDMQGLINKPSYTNIKPAKGGWI